MQDASEKSYVELLFAKYGWTGTAPPAKSEPDMASDSSTGWAYAKITSGDSCDGTEYFNAGVKLNSCVPLYSTTSFYMTCSDGDLNYYLYSSDDCSGSVSSSAVVASTGCNNIDVEFFTFDDDYYTSSIKVECSTSSTPPFENNDASYDIWKGYADLEDKDDDSKQCLSTDFDYYEAYVLDVCIPIQVWSTQSNDESCIFKASTNDDDDSPDDDSSGTPYLKYYTAKHTCEGTHTTYDLSEECVAITDFYWSSKWAYYSN